MGADRGAIFYVIRQIIIYNRGVFVRLELAKFMKFILVGLVNTVVGYALIYMFINVFDLSYFISTFSGYIIVMIFSYVLNSKFTFNKKLKTSGLLKFVFVFIMSYGASYLVGILLIIFLKEHFSLWETKRIHSISSLLSFPFYTLVNYFGNRMITFR
jgi:putative flippase GtrA